MPRDAAEAKSESVVPLDLLAGLCLELCAPETGDYYEARRRYQARQAWQAEHPDQLVTASLNQAWSFTFCRENYGDQYVARMLASRGLPSDRQPTPVRL